MNIWQKYEGKKVFIRTSKERIYIGVIKEIADVGDNIFFISLTTRNGWATIVASEIVEIKEEKDYET